MLDQIQQWYLEAASLHGDDWPNVERYVQNKMAAVRPIERDRLSQAFQALFPFESSVPN